MRTSILVLMLTSVAAGAQNAMPVRPPAPTFGSVARAWQAGLKGRGVDRAGSTPPREVSVVGCLPDETLAAVYVDGCTGRQQSDDRLICGAAVLDLKKGVFTAFVPSHETVGTVFRFYEGVLAKNWEGGVELRFGKGLESSKVIPRGRVLAAAAEPGALLLAIGDGVGERLASLKPGASDPTVLSGRFQSVEQVTRLKGTSLMTATLRPAEGQDTLLVFDAHNNKTVTKVQGVFRHALSPNGMQLLTIIEELNVEKTQTTFVHQLDTRGGKTERLLSSIASNGTVPMAASMNTGRAALGGAGEVDLVRFAPLQRIALVRPFGPTEKILVHTLRWSKDGERLIVFAGEYRSATGKMRQLAAEVNGADGTVVRSWDAIVEKPTEEVRRLLAEDPGEASTETTPAWNPPSDRCTAAAEGITRELAVVTPDGILLPARP